MVMDRERLDKLAADFGDDTSEQVRRDKLRRGKIIMVRNNMLEGMVPTEQLEKMRVMGRQMGFGPTAVQMMLLKAIAAQRMGTMSTNRAFDSLALANALGDDDVEAKRKEQS